MSDSSEMLNDPYFGPIIKAAWDTYNKKGADYTRGLGSENRTDNFEKAAEFCGTTALQAWLVYFYKHVAAVSAYVRNGGSVESEPIEGRLVDVINYAVLLYALVQKEVTHAQDPKAVTSSSTSTASELPSSGTNGKSGHSTGHPLSF